MTRPRYIALFCAVFHSNVQASLTGQCLWYNNYSVTPAQLECVLTYWSVNHSIAAQKLTAPYSDNATLAPNTDGQNYDLQWTRDSPLVRLGDTLEYPCQVSTKPRPSECLHLYCTVRVPGGERHRHQGGGQ